MGYAQPVLAALERLEQAGVEDEDVTLVSVVISKDALETLTEEARDMNVVRDPPTCHTYHGFGGLLQCNAWGESGKAASCRKKARRSGSCENRESDGDSVVMFAACRVGCGGPK